MIESMPKRVAESVRIPRNNPSIKKINIYFIILISVNSLKQIILFKAFYAKMQTLHLTITYFRFYHNKNSFVTCKN
ncbi:hypothetical protein BpHYR1_011052 [Brachionus plicatilis]|uniref:Uncharacterized protein n=1 Tax=Brachionus plicatilis TaxID=10195 RepID=A0A3M7PMY4_BRAPC|nr:hypothetical protein BpHYR1_011052 [Brachionus plicatilis]